MRKELAKTYDPKEFEDRIYDFWIKGEYFKADPNTDKKPYTIVMPPPNITGQLHMGHALDNTLQDILIRFRRMQGFETLWIPGTDHASIATEAKIVEDMKKNGITKDDLGRDGFLERAWQWKETYGGRITAQLKKLGASCDWSRERFTMDEGCSQAVQEFFINLYDKGLIYRGERMINWCPYCLTSISDAEVEHEDKEGHLWHVKYPLADGSGYIQVATTRPETMLGDTAVAVNPTDDRYKDMIGKMLVLPIVNRQIPIIADEYVSTDFGTGAVKITPGHDHNDFQMGLRHSLEMITVTNDNATIKDEWGKYAGLHVLEARKLIVEDLKELGVLVKIEDHNNKVGGCYRCSTSVEPRISKQWFVSMEPLAKPAIDVVRNKDINFIPERFDKTYYHWMENIKDWCISRQLWWGHRIPAWYCGDCGEITVSKGEPECCCKCGGKQLVQDEDTLDTWFSSALWPFSTLGWPNDTKELEKFYPTNTLVTGYDIIFFWVARMIFAGVENMKDIPFENVFSHGLVRDEQGRKMSKSLGNGIDPLEIIEEYGADALRLMLASGNSPGNDMRYSDEKVKSSRNFANKIWNATRFIMMNISDEITEVKLPTSLAIEDKWVISKLNRVIGEVTNNLDKFELGIAVQKLYDFMWDIVCDWYIEIVKSRLQSGGQTAIDAQNVLVYVMSNGIKLLHPFMPFITEEIWDAIPNDGKSIMVSEWPIYKEELSFEKEELEFQKILDGIIGIRGRRTEMNVPPSKKAEVNIETDDIEIFKSGIPFIEKLAFASAVRVGSKQDSEGAVQVITNDARIFIPMSQLVDREKELERLGKEKSECKKDIAFLSGKLNNAGFVAKAPEQVIKIEREKLAKAQDKLAKIEESIKSF